MPAMTDGASLAAIAASATARRRSRRCSWTCFLEAHRASPRQIILDLDATNVPLHGHLQMAEVAVPRRLFAEVP
jgi:hypothetical protein